MPPGRVAYVCCDTLLLLVLELLFTCHQQHISSVTQFQLMDKLPTLSSSSCAGS
jgi:hypothetical protein